MTIWLSAKGWPFGTQRALALGMAVALAACGSGGGGGTAPLQGFLVMNILPPDGGQLVALEAHVMAIFNDVIEPVTVSPAAIEVGIEGSGRIPGEVLFVGPAAIEFVPKAPLEPSTTYAIHVSPVLRSITGHLLGGTTSFLFRTTTAPGDVVPLPTPAQLRATAGKLNTGRRSHTATLLVDGRVLFAGGFSSGYSITTTAELYNPSTEVFVPTGSMSHPRAGHVAVKLGDGRILVAGGWYEAGAETLNAAWTAEIFDPASQEWTEVGSMATPRADAAALLLPDGRVFVTGGTLPAGPYLEDHLSAEVFDPATNAWTTWPVEMAFPHAQHSMVDLLDGRFLIAGGSFDLGCEIFNSVTGTFTSLAAPVGEVSRFGGAAASFHDGDVVICGGDSAGAVSYFDRDTMTVLSTGSGLNAARSYATAVPIASDRILVAGGIDLTHGGTILATCDMIMQGGIAGSRTYSTSVRLPVGLANHTATVLQNGKILFAGGLAQVFGQPEINGAWLFTP